MKNIKDQCRLYVSDNKWLVLFMTILFLIGIIFGAILVNSMSFVQKEEVFFHLQQYFSLIKEDAFTNDIEVLRKSFLFHVKYLLILFVLGMTIIGIPVIWILIFIKGLVVGFSVGFIVNQLGWKGLFFATISIAPQNMLTIPLYILAGTISVHFSIILLRKLWLKGNHHLPMRAFGVYCSVFGSFLVIALCSSVIETFFSNKLFQHFLKVMITIL